MLTRLSEHVMWRRIAGMAVLALTLAMVAAPAALAAQPPTGAPGGGHAPGGEINIQLPDLNQGDFLGMTGHQILLTGLVVCVLGLLFGAWTYVEVKKLPVHESMAEVSALIYETCKAYLVQQGKFLLILELFIGAIMVAYFALIGLEAYKIAIVLITTRNSIKVNPLRLDGNMAGPRSDNVASHSWMVSEVVVNCS